MYKNWGKFHQRIRQRGGSLTCPHPPPKPGHTRKGKRVVATEPRPTKRQLKEWERYIKECEARGTIPKNIPPEIQKALNLNKRSP
jgi:hypothetical protein